MNSYYIKGSNVLMILYKKLLSLSLVLTLLLIPAFIIPVEAIQREFITFSGIASDSDFVLWDLGMHPGYMFDNDGYVNIYEPETFMDRVHPQKSSLCIVDGEGSLQKKLLDPFYLPPGNDVQAWRLSNKKKVDVFLKAKWKNNGDPNKLEVRFEIGKQTDCVYGTVWTQAGPDPTPIFMESLWLGINLTSEDRYPRDWPGQEVPLLPRWDPKNATMTFEGTHNKVEIEGTAILLLSHFPNEDNVDMIFLNLWINDYEIYASFLWQAPDASVYFGLE